MGESEKRITELEALLRRCHEYLGTMVALGAPAAPGIALRQAIADALANGTNSFTGTVNFGPGSLWDSPKCRNLDCWLCHGVPPSAGPR
jgi:hypothetical protein